MVKFDRIPFPLHNSSSIQGIWTLENLGDSAILHLVPDAYPEIVIPIRGNMLSGNESNFYSLTEPIIIGQLNRSQFLKMSANSMLISFKLYPWSLGALTEGNSKALLNKVARLDDFNLKIYRACQEFKEQFLNAHYTIHEALTILHARLSKALSIEYNPFLMYDVSNKFDAIKNMNLSHINNKLKYSKRYVEKIYANMVGISPVQFIKILRVKKISLVLQSNPDVNIHHLLDLLGYYDSSHMYKDFKSVVSQSPSLHFSGLHPLYQHKSYLKQWDYC